MNRRKIHLEIDMDDLNKSLDKMVKLNDSEYVTLITPTILKDKDGDLVFISPLLELFMRSPEKKTMKDLVSDEDIERWMNGKE